MSSPGHFTGWLPEAWFRGEPLSLTRYSLNTVASWLFLVLIPGLILVLPRRKGAGVRDLVRDGFFLGRPENWSWKIGGGVLLLLMAAVLTGLLATWLIPSLRESYPVVRTASRSTGMFLVSCSLTVGLILATELFYRGLALSAMQNGFGIGAVPILAAVYALDHIGAPTAELVGSGFTGLLLGTLALRLRSIWPGFIVHAGCALAVDLTSVWLQC
jgi:membrane protease YdiL (CAAX protease family)